MRIRGLLLCLLIAACPVWCFAQKDRDIKPLRMWMGVRVDDELLSAAEKYKCISNRKDWEKIWTLWNGGEAPKIDFAKHLILFCTTKTPNHCSIEPKLSPKGDLKVRRLTTLIGSNKKTFDYKFALIARAGIRTIEGERLKNRSRFFKLKCAKYKNTSRIFFHPLRLTGFSRLKFVL